MNHEEQPCVRPRPGRIGRTLFGGGGSCLTWLRISTYGRLARSGGAAITLIGALRAAMKEVAPLGLISEKCHRAVFRRA